MGFVMANRGLFTLISTAISGSTDFRCLVTSSVGSPTDAQLEDLNFVTDLGGVGLVEVTNVGYARPDLAGVAVAEDDSGNKVAITATAPVINNVQSGDVWKRIVYFVQVGADSTNPIIGVDTPAATLTPNGGNVTLPPLVVNVTDTSV
jgi:hypothetical protein